MLSPVKQSNLKSNVIIEERAIIAGQKMKKYLNSVIVEISFYSITPFHIEKTMRLK